jgi:hypothetical protein
MEKLGFSASSEDDWERTSNIVMKVRTKVDETGHPSRGKVRPGKGRRLAAGDGNDAATDQAYNNYVINRVLSGNTGTPHRPHADMGVYIFALFNESGKGDGPDDVEQNFGLFYPNMQRVYEFDFNGGGAPESWCVWGRAASGGAGLGLWPRRGLQCHPARRLVLPARHQGRTCHIRLQRLLPAQGQGQRFVRFVRRRLCRLPATE